MANLSTITFVCLLLFGNWYGDDWWETFLYFSFNSTNGCSSMLFLYILFSTIQCFECSDSDEYYGGFILSSNL